MFVYILLLLFFMHSNQAADNSSLSLSMTEALADLDLKSLEDATSSTASLAQLSEIDAPLAPQMSAGIKQLTQEQLAHKHEMQIIGSSLLIKYSMDSVLPFLTQGQRDYLKYNLGQAVTGGMQQSDDDTVRIKVGAFLGHMYQQGIITPGQLKSLPNEWQTLISQGLVGLIGLQYYQKSAGAITFEKPDA